MAILATMLTSGSRLILAMVEAYVKENNGYFAYCDIDRDLNAAINIKRKGIQMLKETKYVGRGTPEFTPVETGSIPAKANPVAETGSPRL